MLVQTKLKTGQTLRIEVVGELDRNQTAFVEAYLQVMAGALECSKMIPIILSETSLLMHRIITYMKGFNE